MSNVTRFDYVRLIFRLDHDAFQAHILPEVRRVAGEVRKHAEDATTYKMAPLGVDASNVARYALDVWGEMADYFILLMPTAWWDFVYRLDLRYTYDCITESALAGLSAHFATKTPGAVGINTFNTPGAKKTDRRDIGGRGIRFGSRKSDRHAVVYKRRSEPGAFEYRAQGKHARWIGQVALATTTSDHLGAVYETAFEMMELEANAFIKQATGRSNFVSLVEWGAYLGKHYASKQTAQEAQEEQEADRWFRGLPEQEQMDLQSSTWEPTPKGWKES